MSIATVRIYCDTGALTGGHGTTQTNVDGTTVKFGLTDAVDASGSPIQLPASAGTNFSYAKALYLNVTVAATTSTNLLNRRIKLDTSPTGLNYHFKAVALGSYTQSTAVADTATGSNGSVPTGYTQITSSLQTYDATSQSSTATGQNGKYVYVASGVDALYTAGGGLSASTTATLQYDEA